MLQLHVHFLSKYMLVSKTIRSDKLRFREHYTWKLKKKNGMHCWTSWKEKKTVIITCMCKRKKQSLIYFIISERVRKYGNEIFSVILKLLSQYQDEWDWRGRENHINLLMKKSDSQTGSKLCLQHYYYRYDALDLPFFISILYLYIKIFINFQKSIYIF